VTQIAASLTAYEGRMHIESPLNLGPTTEYITQPVNIAFTKTKSFIIKIFVFFYNIVKITGRYTILLCIGFTSISSFNLLNYLKYKYLKIYLKDK